MALATMSRIFALPLTTGRTIPTRDAVTDARSVVLCWFNGEDGHAMALAAARAINQHDSLLASLRAILPYAESRAEDMLEADGELDGCDPSDETRKAVTAVDAAKALLASLEAPAHG